MLTSFSPVSHEYLAIFGDTLKMLVICMYYSILLVQTDTQKAMHTEF